MSTTTTIMTVTVTPSFQEQLEEALACIPENWETFSGRNKLKRIISQLEQVRPEVLPYPRLVK